MTEKKEKNRTERKRENAPHHLMMGDKKRDIYVQGVHLLLATSVPVQHHDKSAYTGTSQLVE